LDSAKDYATCCSIAQEARNRGLQDIAEKASSRAELIGPQGYKNNQTYRDAMKNINRAVTYAANNNFIVSDLEAVMSISTPTLIPIGDVIMSAITDSQPDAIDTKIARMVETEIGGLPDAISAPQLKTLRSLSE